MPCQNPGGAGTALTSGHFSLVRVQQLHKQHSIRLALQPEAVVFVEHHMSVGVVHRINKGHRAAALVLVHVKQLARQRVLHQALEGLHHLGY